MKATITSELPQETIVHIDLELTVAEVKMLIKSMENVNKWPSHKLMKIFDAAIRAFKVQVDTPKELEPQ